MLKHPRFKLEEIIYENDPTVIYKGMDIENNQAIVFKTISGDIRNNGYSELLSKEYYLLSHMKSPYVLAPLALIDAPQLGIVMNYVEGDTLKQLIVENKLSYYEKIEIAIQLFEGMEQIHQHKILHKDINPSNLIWSNAKKQLTIIDFNIAELAKSQKMEFVSPDHLQGTLAYISPEQTGRMNRVLDYRSDYYSAGITLYELFTGALPFESADRPGLIHQQIAAIPKAPYELKVEIPLFLSKIIMKLMSKNCEERYQSIEGILHDLRLLKEEDNGTNHQLGLRDYYSELNLPQKTYGRDGVINQLLTSFEDVKQGYFQHVFIKGYSGVGKTTVIRELYQPITRSSGYFISGKFEQYNSATPYQGIIQAVEDFIQLLLMEDVKLLDAWKERFAIALEENIKVIAEFIPAIEDIIGSQEPPESMSGIEAENRFQEALYRLFTVMCDDAHPIVLFLDDLQWVDQGSLSLVQNFLTRKAIPHLYLIGVYRDNEIDVRHRLQVMFDAVAAEDIKINEIQLKPLTRDDLILMIKDAFPGLDRVTYIVTQIIEKTKGNPFFIRQLLHHFYDEKCIVYDENRAWQIDKECLERERVADNVAEFLGGQMATLDPLLIKVLKWASVIGNTFTLKSVAEITEKDMEEIIPCFSILIEENYLLSLGSDRYAFSHDQVQQAAYMLIDAKERAKFHYLTAEMLSHQQGDLITDELIFEIAGHYRMAMTDDIVFEHVEKTYDYFFKAGLLASRSTVYKEALSFYLCADKLTKEDSWSGDYNQMLVLNNQILKAEYMTGAFEELDKRMTLFKEGVNSPRDLATAYEIHIQSYMARRIYDLGIETMLEALNVFGMGLTLEVAPEDYEKAFDKLYQLLGDRSVEDLIDLPVLKKQRLLEEMELLTGIIPLLFNTAPQLLPLVVLEMVFISISHGNCKYSSFGYAFLGTILCGSVGNVDQGISFGQLAVDLTNRLEAVSEIPKVHMVAAQHVLHYKEHLDFIIKMEEEGFYKGLEIGDYTYAGFIGHGVCFNTYLAGKELSKTQKIFETYTLTFDEINQGTQNMFQHIYLQTIENIRTKEDQPWLMEGPWFNEKDMVATLENEGHQTALFVYYFNKMQLCYLFDQMDDALLATEGMAMFLAGGTGLMHVPIYHHYAALIKLALMDKLDGPQIANRKKEIEEHIAYLEGLGKRINYYHRSLSVKAAYAYYQDELEFSRQLLEEAIQLVQSYGYLREEAMYREQLGLLYNKLDMKELSLYYQDTAYRCYEKWGAIQKLGHYRMKLNQQTTIAKGMVAHTLHSINTSLDVEQQIDMYSILKFSQAMSEMIVYDELLKKLLHILLENAGAERAVITNYIQDKRIMIADCQMGEAFKMSEYDSLDAYERLPHKILRYVLNGKKIVRLDRASSEVHFMDDPYIKHNNILSVLCFPLINKGKILGVIYMENNLAEGVFSSERMEFLSLLSSQIAISLENAMVYKNLESLVEQRTKDLAEKNEELNSLNHKLQELSVTDGLTRLYNRRKLDEVLQYEYDKAMRYKSTLAVILLDIDRFKLINDDYGHLVGDQVLMAFAKLLEENTRSTDTLGRWGGEEFLIIAPELDKSHAIAFAEKLRHHIASYAFESVGKRTASFGVSILEKYDEIKDLMKRVDDALYDAKRSGRNKVTFLDRKH